MLKSIWRSALSELRGEPEPTAFLSAQQARDIAETAAAATHHAGNMCVTEFVHRDGRWVWVIGSGSVGSGITAIIDDATATVLSCEPWGVR